MTREILSLLYLSRADVEAAAIDLGEIENAVGACFKARGEARATVPPKMAMHPPLGAVFHAMPAALHEPALAGIKWVGLSADNAARGLPHINSLMVVNDLATGVPAAIMDGTWITATRTAAVTAVGARHLARRDAASLGVIGCGVQAESNLDALRRGWPLTRLRAYSRSRVSAETFCARATAAGLDARVVDQPREAVAGLDIVVSTVPAAPGLTPFLDPEWLAPGAYVSAVDLARSWRADRLVRLDLLATDDREQTRAVAASGQAALQGPFHADLAELTTGRHPGRQSPLQRCMLIHPGFALADIAVADIVLRVARAKGLGTRLSL